MQKRTLTILLLLIIMIVLNALWEHIRRTYIVKLFQIKSFCYNKKYYLYSDTVGLIEVSLYFVISKYEKKVYY